MKRPPRFIRPVACFGCRAMLALGLILGSGEMLRAGNLDTIGYTRLAEELGDRLPTGAGVRVAQSEAQTEAQSNADLTPVPDLNEFDDLTDEFDGKMFTPFGGEPTVTRHASRVGARFYGNTLSAAPGVTQVANYSADGWLADDVLRFGFNLPRVVDARVANHSWVGDSAGGSAAFQSLMRTDWLVDTDELVQIVGVNNGNSPNDPRDELAGAMNIIAVGLSGGDHSSGTNCVVNGFCVGGVDAVYSDDRMRPHLVAPESVTSFAAPLVAGTAAMLIELARDPALSNGSFSPPNNRRDVTLQNAESTEVIRATLLAGANRKASFGATYQPQFGPSDNGMDRTFGAGELDAYQSYHILAAGEQESIENGGGDVRMYGFDYNDVRWTTSTTPTPTYTFTIDGLSRNFAASLSWNLSVNLAGTSEPLRDLDLKLLNVTNPANAFEVQVSASDNDTTENLYVENLAPGRYELVVNAPDASALLGAFDLDYGLAWRFAPETAPLMGDVNLDGMVSLLDLLILKSNLGRDSRVLSTDGDLNGDGLVNRIDVALLVPNFGARNPAAAVSAASVSAVPEPSSFLLLCLGVVYLLRRKQRAWKSQYRRRSTVGGDSCRR